MWMKSCHEQVLAKPQSVFIGVGSHLETVVTQGRNPDLNRLNMAQIRHYFPKALIRPLERGGGPTAHEPGQVVLYPVLDLQHWGLTPQKLIATLQEVASYIVAQSGLMPIIKSETPGVFVGDCKVGFIGMRITNHIASHGLALNVSNDADIFSCFNPCGIAGLKVSSLKKCGGQQADLSTLFEQVIAQFCANLPGSVFPSSSL